MDKDEKAKVRSWTDPISNAMLLSGFDVLEYARWLSDRKVQVNEILPDFLHEYTHHWCFNSLVGGTIACLHIRAAQTAFLTECATPDAGDQTMEDLVRVRASLKLLEPLAEGLAQFAEFDVRLSTKHNFISRTLSAALCCFGFNLGGEEGPRLTLHTLLQNVRRTDDFCERKAGRFARPVSGTDPYLGGYLAVKALHGAAIRQSELLWDADVFFGFLRAWFYDDPVFVSVLLSPETTGLGSARAIYNHLTDRLNEFLSSDLDREAQLWVESAIKPRTDIFIPGLARTRDQFADADAALEPIFYEDQMVAERDQRIKATLAFKRILAENRRYTILGTLQAQANSESDGTIALYPHDDPSLRIVATGYGTVVEPQEATVLIIWDGTLLSAFAIIGERSVAIDSLFLNPLSAGSEQLEAVARFAGNYKALLQLSGAFDAALERVGSKQGFRLALTVLDEVCAHFRNDLYLNVATLFVPDPGRARVIESLREAGLFAVLGYDGDLTLALAAIGLANTSSHGRGAVQLLLQLVSMDLDAVLPRLIAIQESTGARLVAGSDESVVAMV